MIILKIVFIDKDIDVMGGVERIINTLANSLCNNNKVSVISEHKNNSNSFFKYDDRIEMYYIYDRVDFIASKKAMNSFLLKFKNLFNSIADYTICRNLSKEVSNCILEADCLVFGRVNTALNFLPLLKKIKSGKRKIIVRDAIHLELYNNFNKRRMKKYFPDLVNCLIVSSDESLNRYKNFFATTSSSFKVKKIYNPLGIVPSKSNHDSKKIVSLGRIDKQKGFENLILAFKKVNESNPDWTLDLYGNGPEKDNLLSLIKENGLDNVVSIYEPSKDVSSIFASAAIYVMTSRYEGYANTLVEALACGTPSISYDWLMGVDDIIENGKNGLIVKLKDRAEFLNGCINQDDINNLAEAIIKLINDCELRKKFINNSAKIIETRNKDIIINKWKDIIEK